jgi:hypothetical protein
LPGRVFGNVFSSSRPHASPSIIEENGHRRSTLCIATASLEAIVIVDQRRLRVVTGGHAIDNETLLPGAYSMNVPDTLTKYRTTLRELQTRTPGFLRAREVPIALVFLVLCFYFWKEKPNVFLRPANLAVIMRFVATYGLLAIGELLVILTRGIDLSVGSMTALTGVLVATLMMKGLDAIPPFNNVLPDLSPMGIWAAIVLVLAFSALVGIWHGLFVTKFHIPTLIAS